MAERQLPKLNVAGSIPVSRSKSVRALAVASPDPREHGIVRIDMESGRGYLLNLRNPAILASPSLPESDS